MFSSLRSLLPPSIKSYRFSRTPARVTLVVAGVASALLAITVVALGLALGGPSAARPPGHSPAALAANSGAASGAASGTAASSAAPKAAVAGGGTKHHAPAAKHSPVATPAPAQATEHRHHHHHHHHAAQAQVTAQAQPKPFLIYDSVNPQAIPGDPVVATYADGPHPDSPSEVDHFSHVMWVDIDASDPHADALDIEPGCASPSEAAGWVSARLNANPHRVAILYTMISQWATVKADVSSLPAWMQSRIRWWIADPTGSPHVVPGSQATQWYWGQDYDISTALPDF